MRAIGSLLSLVACGFVGCAEDELRADAPCSKDGTCPPGQECVPGENICRVPCTMQGPCGNGGGCECNGPQFRSQHECDGDLWCRPACGNGPPPSCAGSTSGPGCPEGEACDNQFNVCRPLCDEDDSCAVGSVCATDSLNSCAICRPQEIETGECPSGQERDGDGICRVSCTTPFSCSRGYCECNDPSLQGQQHECDFDGFCRPTCGGAYEGQPCAAGGPWGCPSGNVCDTEVNICRPGCESGDDCNSGAACLDDAITSCRFCWHPIENCPKGSLPDSEGRCRVPCSDGPCQPSSIGWFYSCDFDQLCRPACGNRGSTEDCGPTFGYPVPGACPDGQACDTEFNVCRRLCAGESCEIGQCTTDSKSGCEICRPADAGGVLCTAIPADDCQAFACGEGCYAYCGSVMTWEAAQMTCQDWGGCLAVIEDSGEATCLGQHSMGGSSWVGLRRDAIMDAWYWECGVGITPPGTVVDLGNCGVLDSAGALGWQSCVNHSYICEYGIAPPTK